jgi:hypothetical protein
MLRRGGTGFRSRGEVRPTLRIFSCVSHFQRGCPILAFFARACPERSRRGGPQCGGRDWLICRGIINRTLRKHSRLPTFAQNAKDRGTHRVHDARSRAWATHLNYSLLSSSKNSGNILLARSSLNTLKRSCVCSILLGENASTMAAQFSSITDICFSIDRTSLPGALSRSRRIAASYHSVGRPEISDTSANQTPRSDSTRTAILLLSHSASFSPKGELLLGADKTSPLVLRTFQIRGESQANSMTCVAPQAPSGMAHAPS